MSEVKELGVAAFDFLDKEDKVFHVKDIDGVEFQVVSYSDVVDMISMLVNFNKNIEAERDALQARLNEAVGRIKDILMQDDGQAYKEAEKFLDKLEGKGDE